MEVDIKVSETLDRLIFTPRNGDEGRAVLASLKLINPGIRFHRTAEGICVNSMDLDKLNLEISGIKMHWSELAEKFFSNRKWVSANRSIITKKIKAIRVGGKSEAIKNLKRKLIGLEVLDDHQIVNVACMTLSNGPGLCVFDEQGAGKTVTLIFAYDILVEQNEIDFALIIAPKSMISEWPVDFERFMPGRYKIQTISGNKFDKRKHLSNKTDVIVTNFETAVTMEQELRAIIRKHGKRAMIVVDESFHAKNLNAQRTKAIKRLREYCGRAFVLCGTPAPNSPIDLIQQINIVDFGMTFDGRNIPEDKDEAAQFVYSLMEENAPFTRHLKSQVLPNLPSKKFIQLLLPLRGKQSQLYKDYCESLVSELSAITNKDFEKKKMSFLAKRSALLQICSNPISIANDYSETPAKLLAIDSLLEKLIDIEKQKVIIWSFYTASLSTLYSRYSRYNPVRYDGTVADTNQRREAVRKFKEDKETMLFIGNPAAAGAGLNLQTAHFAIYESMSNQAAHYLQSLDRIHRRGQLNEVEYYILLCKDTIEVAEYARLLTKESSAEKVLGDSINLSITRESLLFELN